MSIEPGKQEVIALCVWAELTYEQAAVAMNVPVGTVRSRLSRARAKLRARVAAPTRPISMARRDMRRLDLPPTRSFAGPRAEAIEHLLYEVVASRARPRRSRRRMVAAIAGVGLAGAGVAVARTVLAPAADDSLVRCHSTVQVGRGDDFAGTSVASAVPGGGPVPMDHAVEACRDLWQQGLRRGSDRVGSPGAGGSRTVPPLVGCVDTDGVAAVFPGDPGLCPTLGLRSLRTGG
ncbi:hypothetical protein BN12_200046 [Nostocoides japonicum T1-X7]|nr:sigma factor-like helix-turn-helix DNA-binding protein [Tetrasphaera japonica]CCH77550.1 hypothetical protein BN12_200046 [Tetrasphaera japonica T1-X7]